MLHGDAIRQMKLTKITRPHLYGLLCVRLTIWILLLWGGFLIINAVFDFCGIGPFTTPETRMTISMIETIAGSLAIIAANTFRR